MSSDSAGSQAKTGSETRDKTVLEMIARLLVETERLIKLADDLSTHAKSPKAESALNLIRSEVGSMLAVMETSIDPLYVLYDIDPGLKAVKPKSSAQAAGGAAYDESELWGEMEKS